jgi:hypothetical protein
MGLNCYEPQNVHSLFWTMNILILRTHAYCKLYEYKRLTISELFLGKMFSLCIKNEKNVIGFETLLKQ